MFQPAADLRQFNRAEVLYQALFKHLYTSEADVIQVTRAHTPARSLHMLSVPSSSSSLQLVLSCLLDLLLVLEKPPSSLGPSCSRRKPCRHDDVLRLVLTHMEAEHKVALRRVYVSALPLYVERYVFDFHSTEVQTQILFEFLPKASIKTIYK